jgi:choline dehydrogenase-like flavoprotein
VCKILHVKTPKDEDHNAGNQTLLEGARRLGYVCKSVPQNITGSFADHRECGANCTVGCRGRSQADDAKTGRSGKMSGERAFLDEFLHLDPEQSKGGKANKVTVEILDKFEVKRVVFEEIPGVSGKKAIGVLGTVKDNDGTVHNAFVKASKVVVSAGALNSPCILLRSGLKVSFRRRRQNGIH